MNPKTQIASTELIIHEHQLQRFTFYIKLTYRKDKLPARLQTAGTRQASIPNI